VNRGILECHQAGTLSSASMMVNTPAFHEAAALVHEQAPALGVGLHLNLIVGRPLAAVPTLADPRTGDFYPLAQLGRHALEGRVSPDDVRRECDAQLSALARAGIAATHLDSHRHAHAFPGILRPVLASARSAGLGIVRKPLDRPPLFGAATGAKMIALHAAWHVAMRGASADDRSLIAQSPTFRGIALQGAPDVERRLLALLDRLTPGTTEIMMHPGYDDPVLAAQDPYRAEREREVAALRSAALLARLSRGDVRLVSFAQI
jgi:predicted glycoside hydrolase/deacetylase ChbG (UPF0249 family)